MKFTEVLQVSRPETLGTLGYGHTPADSETSAMLQRACQTVEQEADARYACARFPLDAGLHFGESKAALSGRDIAAHLQGCSAAFLLAVTLGSALESALRKAEVTDMQLAVLMDAAASTLIEQYADLAEAAIRAGLMSQGEYLTGRFSPGYGDFPLAFQTECIRLLDAPRTIGLTVSQSGLLLPQKSITAVLGIASHPVTGQAADCSHCRLYENCARRKERNFCGKPRI